MRPVPTCVYCGVRDADTVDHVPPKNLFAKPRPRLITVPACLSCNAGAALDDEYFRLTVALRHDIDHPDAAAVLDSVVRSLSRPRGAGLRATLLKRTKEIELHSPAGLYLGRTAAYGVDVSRLDRVVRRIVLGLFYDQTGQPLPRHYEARAFLLSQIRPEVSRQLSDIITTLLRCIPAFVGRRVLSYRWQRAREDPNGSAWLLIFYERVAWIAITAPPTSRVS